MNKKVLEVNKNTCVACGACVKVCPTKAISISYGSYASIDKEKCVACGKCKTCCPASAISIDNNNKGKKVPWYDNMWLVSILYLVLGFFNIIIATVGMICMLTPLAISFFNKSKSYCNKYCGKGQLFNIFGSKLNLSANRDLPVFLTTKLFRYLFLAFYIIMFSTMIYSTYSVFIGTKELSKIVTLLWVFKLPWDFSYIEYGVKPWLYQFSYGFYSIMLTSNFIGFIMMLLFKPKSWCVACPVGTATQLICQSRNSKHIG